MKPTISFVIAFLLFIMLVAHTISHGQNNSSNSIASGLAIGQNCPAFDPVHISGPDKGTKACPMCRYGQQQGVMIWLNTDNLTIAGKLADRLEREIEIRGLKKMRAFIIYMNPDKKSTESVEAMLTDFSKQHKLSNVAVTHIPDPTDSETAAVYEINPDARVQNTILVYKRRGIYQKFINLSGTETEIESVITAITTAEKDKKF